MRELGVVLFASALGCGRLGYDQGARDAGQELDGALPPLALSLDEPRIFNGADTATFSGNCELGLSVEVDNGDTQSCATGRFAYETPPATTDGLRSFAFLQRSPKGQEGRALGQWQRSTEPPSLSLDDNPIRNALDRAFSLGNCTSTASSIEVTGAGSGTAVCTGGRFSYETPMETTDGERVYGLRQQNGAGVSDEVQATWIRTSDVPRVELDERFLSTRGDAVTFAGRCESGAGLVDALDAGTNRMVPCDGDRFTITTQPRTEDGTYPLVVSQTVGAETASDRGTWQRLSAPLEMSTMGVDPASGFGDAVDLESDRLVVGAPLRSDVWVYVRGPTGWSAPSRVDLPPSAERDFGEDVLLDGDLLFVGANPVGGTSYAHSFRWTGRFELLQEIPGTGRLFSNRLSADNEWLVAGVLGAFSGGVDSAGLC